MTWTLDISPWGGQGWHHEVGGVRRKADFTSPLPYYWSLGSGPSPQHETLLSVPMPHLSPSISVVLTCISLPRLKGFPCFHSSLISFHCSVLTWSTLLLSLCHSHHLCLFVRPGKICHIYWEAEKQEAHGDHSVPLLTFQTAFPHSAA